MPHSLNVSGQISYKKRAVTGDNFLLVRISCTENSVRQYFIWKVTSSVLIEKIEALRPGTVIGLFNAKLSPTTYKTADGTCLPFIIKVEDIVCPALANTSAKEASSRQPSITEEDLRGFV